MRGALALRIEDGVTDRHVTRDVTGLSFSKVAPGGHESLTARINQPRSAFPDLGPADRVYLHDTRTGRCILDGYTANPTPVDGQAGQAFDLAAVGGMTLASDETRQLMYVSQATGTFAKHVAALESSTAEQVSGDSTTLPFLRVQFAPGSLVTTADTAWIHDVSMGSSDMALGGFVVSTASGKNDDGYRVEFTTSLPQAIPIGFSGAAMSLVGVQQTLYVGTDFSPARGFGMRLIRTAGATNIADEATWSLFAGIAYIGQRMDRYGQLLTGAAGLGPASTVNASQVVEDLLGRLLRNTCDPAVAAVSATTMPIYQLAWPDGATAQRVLDELARWEPDMLWEILESAPGGHRFAYRPWPTDPRYEISVRDGYRETGSDDDLCNRISVTWNDATGTKQTTIVTAASDQYPGLADLERAGRVRDADSISLEDGLGSVTNAQTIGTQKLAAINAAPTAAIAVVSRRIYDHYAKALVDPWEIEPGYLVHVRETGQDLRLTRMEYTDASCSTALTLGEPVLSDEQRIARLERVA